MSHQPRAGIAEGVSASRPRPPRFDAFGTDASSAKPVLGCGLRPELAIARLTAAKPATTTTSRSRLIVIPTPEPCCWAGSAQVACSTRLACKRCHSAAIRPEPEPLQKASYAVAHLDLATACADRFG